MLVSCHVLTSQFLQAINRIHYIDVNVESRANEIQTHITKLATMSIARYGLLPYPYVDFATNFVTFFENPGNS